MRTSALVVVALAVLSVAVYADGNCTMRQEACMGEGDDCVGDFFVNGSEVCKNETKCCGMPLYCVGGVCVEDTRDANCTSDDDCWGAAYGTGIITCIKNKCIVQGSFNDSCTKDDHCAGDQKCAKDKCNGLPLQAKCNPEKGFQCGMNKTCLNGLCVEALNLGDKCSDQDECGPYRICNNDKCIDPWSLEKDAICTIEDACGKGLICVDGKCKEAVKRQHIVCSTDADCSSYGSNSSCTECDAITGQMYCKDPDDVEPDCISELITAYKCYLKNGCSPVPSSSLDTCAQLECTAETNAIFACQSLCEDLKMVAGKRCLSELMLRYCPLLATWLRIVIAFSILIVIILVVFVVYAIYNCIRRKKNPEAYDKLTDDTEPPTAG